MLFEWDENKNQINRTKHGIDFQDAAEVFKDPAKVEIIDQRKSYGEIRYQTIGMVDDEVLLVVYTVRNDRCRIISARRARKNERKNYCI